MDVKVCGQVFIKLGINEINEHSLIFFSLSTKIYNIMPLSLHKRNYVSVLVCFFPPLQTLIYINIFEKSK